MSDKKLTITWDDLQSRKVDTRLKEQEALARNRAYAQLDASEVADTSTTSRGSIWYNAIFYMAVFGLAGGLLAWGFGAALQFKPSAQAEADVLLAEMQKITVARDTHRFDADRAADAIEQLKAEGSGNAYLAVSIDPNLSPLQKDERIQELAARDRSKEFIANVLSFGVCGLFIALCLAVAEPLTQRNWPGAVVNGSMGALLGLLGGLVVALFTDRLYRAAGSMMSRGGGIGQELFAQAVTWGVLGLFLSAAAGVVLRNRKKLLIGVLGGLVGGVVGGMLFVPVRGFMHSPQAARLVALVAIGVLSGVATALVENAAKNGWLRVIAGVLAGKQFILYRNPTFIGASPDCQIYLFKDLKVGQRHAAIHIVPGGFEIEDLPLGVQTTINGKTVRRARLRNGDRIQCGSTAFLFQEKE